MSSFLTSALALLVTLGVLIAFHEFGHYWVARRMGVKVLKFSIGFGKPLWMKKSGPDETEYCIAAIPLGGYVKMLDEREADTEVPESEVHRAFNRQNVWKRIAIVAAGPVFNFIFAIAAYFIMYMAGVPGVKPLIGEVEPESAAYVAGLQQGDQILAVGKEETPTWNVARLSLLNESLDNDSVEIEVKSETGKQRLLTLELSGVSAEEKQKDLIQHLGMTIWRPSLPPVLGKIVPGGAAERDGLQTGDRVLSVDGVPVESWMGWVHVIQKNADKTLRLELERNQITEVLMLTPKPEKHDGKIIGRIGAGPKIPEKMPTDHLTEVRYGPAEAINTALVKTWQMSVLTLRMIGKMIVGEVSVKNLSGPITIATYAGKTASIGLTTFLSFLAIVSISLGVLNLLPIPLLDGGHLLYYLIEIIKRKPLSENTQARMQQIGILLLGTLMTVAIYNDIYRLIGE